jgi:hypothetical protein
MSSPQGNEVQGFTVEDLDTSDKRREVFVHTLGRMDEDHRVLVYAFDGKRFIELGRLPWAVEVRGNGSVLIGTHMGFWSRVDKYVLDRKQNRFSRVEQDVYWVGVEATVSQTFPLQRSRTDGSLIANVAPDTRILLVAAAPQPGNGDKDWYLIKTSTGLMGWARLQSFATRVKDLPWVG